MPNLKSLESLRRRICTIIDIGTADDLISRAYDIFYTLVILVNLVVTIAYTFDEAEAACGPLLLRIEAATVAFFAVDCILRIWTAKYHHPNLKEWKAVCRYIFSFSGIVDLLSFLPYYMPFFFPSGAVAFRMFRVVRIFRLFRINAYYDSLNVITQVLTSKAQQLLSSVFIILVLMTASSLCMYSLEHDAQPDVFSNAFSGIWWAVSTLLTVGYGDIYPITTLGKIFGILIILPGRGHGGDPHRYHFRRLRGPVFPPQADQRIRHGGGHSLHPHPPDPPGPLGQCPAAGSGHFPTDGHHHGPPPEPNADPQRRPEAAGG